MALNPTSRTTGSTSHQAFWLTVFEFTPASCREPAVDVQLSELGVAAHVGGLSVGQWLVLAHQQPDHRVGVPGLDDLVAARVAGPEDTHGDAARGEPDELGPHAD